MISGIQFSTTPLKQPTIAELSQKLSKAEENLLHAVAKVTKLTTLISVPQNLEQDSGDELEESTRAFHKGLLLYANEETSQAQFQVDKIKDALYQAIYQTKPVGQKQSINELFFVKPELQREFKSRFRRNSISTIPIDGKIALLHQELLQVIKDPKHDLTTAITLNSAIKRSRKAGAIRSLTDEQREKVCKEANSARDVLRTLQGILSKKTARITLDTLVKLKHKIDAQKTPSESLKKNLKENYWTISLNTITTHFHSLKLHIPMIKKNNYSTWRD